MRAIIAAVIVATAILLIAGRTMFHSSSGTTETYIDRTARLNRVMVVNVAWKKDAPQGAMLATISFHNTHPFDVKDVEVTCEHFGEGGTLLDRNVRTISATLKSNSFKTVPDIEMGREQTQAARSTCAVSNFVS